MHVRITDLALAEVAETTSSAGITRETAHGLTWFMAPELLEQAARPSYASDVWSFGCLCLLVSDWNQSRMNYHSVDEISPC